MFSRVIILTRALLEALAAVALVLSIVGAAQAQGTSRTAVIGNYNNPVNSAVIADESFVDDLRSARKKAARQRRARAAKSASHKLPSNLKSGIGNLSGKSLDNVRVHRNRNSTRSLGARAYAKGTKIHIAPGQAKHLPHEAWHVTQKNGGQVTGQAAKLKNAKRFSNAGKASNFAKKAKAARTMAKTHQAAKVARHANTANKFRKGVKAANTARNVAKIAAAGTGVGAVVGITAGLAGVDPIEMATLKATNPAEYNRRMRSLKKNPAKYMGNNIKNNTKKVAANVGNATKKAGCGIGNMFKKKGKKKKC